MKPGRFNSVLFFLFSKPENEVDEYTIIRASIHPHLSNVRAKVNQMSSSPLQRGEALFFDSHQRVWREAL